MDLHLVRHLLADLLRDGPEVGARLKQRLSTEFVLRGEGPFRERAWGYAKFTDFLEGQRDLLTVERPNGPGDIRVALLAQHAVSAPVKAPAAAPSQQLRVHHDVWRAFTSSDSNQDRYFDRVRARVVQTTGGDAAAQGHVASTGDLVAISAIGGEQQVEWMREYVRSLPIGPVERSPIERILDESYSSKLNSVFTSALGVHAAGWRQTRFRRVIEHIQRWARVHNIPFSALEAQVPVRDTKVEGDGEQSPRRRASALLALLTEEDIATLVLPTIVAAIQVTSRSRKQ